jgi:hypothetical protein
MFYVTRTVLVELAISALSSQGATGLSVCNNVHKVFWNIPHSGSTPYPHIHRLSVSLPPCPPPSLPPPSLPAPAYLTRAGGSEERADRTSASDERTDIEAPLLSLPLPDDQRVP